MSSELTYKGRSGSKVLYLKDSLGVVLDESTNSVVSVDSAEELSSQSSWRRLKKNPPSDVSQELASAALTELDITVLGASDRMYTIPKGVVAEAKRGLKWRKEEDRGGTRVGLNTARTLAKGGQIGIRKVRHIAKYFPRHEVDKKAKGYDPGEDNYPSNGRIAWALWGGDAAQRWASAIVEREDKKESAASLIASYYGDDDDRRVDLRSFDKDEEVDFYVRLRLDKGGMDRLYRVQPDGMCHVWDDGYWDDLGNVEHDFKTYDAALDDPYDRTKKVYIPIDRETAVAVAAMFDNEPFRAVFLKEIEFEETDMFEKAMPEMDWELLDQLSSEIPEELEEEDEFDDGLMASGTATFAEEGDGEYTPEERSENASQQVRDKLGRFAETGSTVVIGGDANYSGVITAQNPDAGTVTVELDNGNSVEVPGDTTQEISSFEPISYVPPSTLDFTGILGEPRTPIDQAGVKLPGRLPALNANDLQTVVNDWGSWASDQRLEPEYEPEPAKPFIPKEAPDIETAMGRYYQGAFNADGSPKSSWNPAIAPNVANEPLLRDWLDSTYGGASGEYRGGWYKPTVPVEERKSRDEVYGVTAAGDAKELTPETSDVPPMYMAIVSQDDPQAVTELISLVPTNTKSPKPTVFKRRDQKWVRDDKILADLNSPTPPPVVVLNNEDLSAVVEQVDGVRSIAASVSAVFAHTNNDVIRSLIAAGGADRNRGGAENLRRYWTVGKGGLKIRWNTPGDWTRCNRQLKKYMGPRAKGYCANRHKEMTGVWPGDKRNVGKKKTSIMASAGESSEIDSLKSSEQIIEEFTLRARAESARSRMSGRSGPKPTEHGSRFVIPLVIPEEVETGDGRIFRRGSITMRDLPLPLLWQIKTGQGHDGSVVVGQIVHMERLENGIGNAYGYFDIGSFGREAERLVRHGFVRGVSADMDKFETDEEPMPEIEASDDDSDETDNDKSDKINIKSARVMAVTIVPKPAFQECYIQVVDESNDVEEETMQPDGVYVDGVNPLDASALVACGMVADAVPTTPPKEWFDNPKLDKATPLTITDDGKVFGHIAAWNVDHIGMAGGTRPPRSRSNYAYFHTGAVRTNSGDDVPVGQLTLSGGHAGLNASAEEAVRHYDDTASAFADVHAGEDAYGIWVAGSLRPGTTPEQIRAARASAPSGDWRPIKGRLELVAVCQVNVPGFPVARARVASGQVMALVAAGANTLAQMKYDPLADLNAKVAELEAAQYAPKADEARDRFAGMRQEVFAQRAAELASKVKKVKDTIEEDDWSYMIEMMDDDPQNETAVVSRRVRERLAKEGKAMPDGSFPIRSPRDLRNAIKAYDKARPGARGAVRKHIMRRAMDLKKEDMLPPRWSTAFSADGEELSLRERALAAATEVQGEAANDNPCWDGYKQVGMKEGKDGKMVPNCVPDGTSAIANGKFAEFADDSCPPATQDVQLNIKNRQNAIDTVAYGPLNPAEPNEDFWQDKAERWDISPKEAKTAVCGNCIFFIRTPSMLDCIEEGIGSEEDNPEGSIEAGQVGYCNAFDFKCASERTCDAWAAGGPVTEENEKSEVVSASGSVSEFRDVSQEERERLAGEGKAMPDGAYPIANEGDLKNAIQAFGRAKESERTAVRKHIVKRARGLDRQDLIPENWPEAPEKYKESANFKANAENLEAVFAEPEEEIIEDLDPEEVEVLKREARRSGDGDDDARPKYTPETQPRDEAGKFRQVLARLKSDLGESGLQDVIEKVEEAENLTFGGDYERASQAADDLINIIDRLDEKALNPESLENVRNSAGELGRVISNLPFAFGEQTEKIRFSDVPPALQTLIEDMITRVEDKLGQEDADIATEELRNFMSGGDFYSQADISSEMSKLLRLLT